MENLPGVRTFFGEDILHYPKYPDFHVLIMPEYPDTYTIHARSQKDGHRLHESFKASKYENLDIIIKQYIPDNMKRSVERIKKAEL